MVIMACLNTKAKNEMGAITKKFDVKVDCIVTESYIYAPVDLSLCKDVKRVKVVRSLWDREPPSR